MRTRANLIANFAGQGWAAVVAVVFIPYYIDLLGIEAFALIGFFTMLQFWLALLDLGIVPTTAREMARYSSGAISVEGIRDLLRSFELLCLGIGLLIALGLWFASGFLGSEWFNGNRLDPATIGRAVALMGVVVGLRLGEGLYRSCLVGLEHQVWLNAATAGIATLRSGGAVAALLVFGARIETFFLWQAFLSFVAIALLGLKVHSLIPDPARPARFSVAAMRTVGRFAAGMMGINFLSLLLMQSDKVVLSRLLPLESYGYYMLASTLAGLLYTLVGPITQAVYPVFVRRVTEADSSGESATFHQFAQFATAIVAPAALTLVFLGRPLIFAWSGDPSVADAAAPLVAMLALGTLFHTLMHLPYYLTLAHGWTSVSLRANTVAVVLLVPLLLWLVPRYGAIAGAAIWAVLTLGYLVFLAWPIFRRLLPGELRRWYVRDLLRPVTPAVALLAAASYLPLAGEGRIIQGVVVVLAGALALSASLLTVEGAPARVRDLLRLWTRRRSVG